jgi:hypothetical protein
MSFDIRSPNNRQSRMLDAVTGQRQPLQQAGAGGQDQLLQAYQNQMLDAFQPQPLQAFQNQVLSQLQPELLSQAPQVMSLLSALTEGISTTLLAQSQQSEYLSQAMAPQSYLPPPEPTIADVVSSMKQANEAASYLQYFSALGTVPSGAAHAVENMTRVIAQHQSLMISFSMSGSISFGGSSQRIEEDEFGVVGMGMGKNHRSNLANSPEVVLALNNILKGKGNMKSEKVKELLSSEYGIEAEVTEINGRKALQFANGDFIVDGNGNGGLDMNDYNFKGAVQAIQDRFGISPEDFDQLMGVSRGQDALLNSLGKTLQNSIANNFSFGFDFSFQLMVNQLFWQAFQLAEQ